MIDAYRVSYLARYLKDLLESDLQLSNLWIEGEVSNLSRSTAGHAYFTLKDQNAQLRCVMFRRAYGGGPLESGQQVLAHGNISFYEMRGDVQLVIDFVRPAGIGVSQAQFDRLKAQLEEEGLFEQARKRPLPVFPQRIGVATSPSGAVFHDICHVLERRWPLTELLFAPTVVQGAEAVVGIVDALRALNDTGADVIILARGGGAIEELSAFNEEPVARAIYASRAPVISGVGHETDYTIADMVADLRAPTPSAAAELAAPDVMDVRRRLNNMALTLHGWTAGLVNQRRGQTEQEVRVLQRSLPDLPTLQTRLAHISGALVARLSEGLQQRRQALTSLDRHLAQLDPRGTLARGYAIVQQKSDGAVVSSVDQVSEKQPLDVFVQDGRFPVEVSRQHGF